MFFGSKVQIFSIFLAWNPLVGRFCRFFSFFSLFLTKNRFSYEKSAKIGVKMSKKWEKNTKSWKKNQKLSHFSIFCENRTKKKKDSAKIWIWIVKKVLLRELLNRCRSHRCFIWQNLATLFFGFFSQTLFNFIFFCDFFQIFLFFVWFFMFFWKRRRIF